MDENGIKEFLEMVLEALTSEELFKQGQKHTTEETREKETAEGKKKILNKIHSERFNRSFCRPQQAS